MERATTALERVRMVHDVSEQQTAVKPNNVFPADASFIDPTDRGTQAL